MDKYVVSRELAEKLKAAGYPQKSTVCRWVENKVNGEWRARVDGGINFVGTDAPMTDELLEQLPKVVIDNQPSHYIHCTDCKHTHDFKCRLEISKNMVCYVNDSNPRTIPYLERYDKLPDALAELWLWCKENGHV